MKYCYRCGTKISDDAAFCEKCGANQKIHLQDQNEPLKDVNTKQCRFCNSFIDTNASVCPNCKKKQSKRDIPYLLDRIFLVIVAFLIIIYGVPAVYNYYVNNFSSDGLTLENEKGYSKGITSTWEGEIINNSSTTKNNVKITYKCYNKNKEYVGESSTIISDIKPGERLKYKTTGIVKESGGLTCSSDIKVNYSN